MKKTILWIIFAVVSGVVLGRITFEKYDSLKVEEVISFNKNTYMLRYKTYDNINEMEKDIHDIDRYIYIEDDKKVTVYIAITSNKDNIKKIRKLYSDKGIKTSIEKVEIDNDEFIQNLNEYEKLLTAAESESSILTIENQILSCYEQLVVNNE